MKKSRLLGTFCAAVFAVITLPVSAAFIPVLGGLAYYDDQLDITWTANADINGTMDWTTANAWAAGLTIGGVSGWRLPNADVNGDGTIDDCVFAGMQAACMDNELGHFASYGAGTTLGLGAGITILNPGPFSNVYPGFYWSSTESAYDPTKAWGVSMFDTFVSTLDKSNNTAFSAWAVHSGNVGAVPIPAAVWLFGSGLIGLLGLACREH